MERVKKTCKKNFYARVFLSFQSVLARSKTCYHHLRLFLCQKVSAALLLSSRFFIRVDSFFKPFHLISNLSRDVSTHMPLQSCFIFQIKLKLNILFFMTHCTLTASCPVRYAIGPTFRKEINATRSLSNSIWIQIKTSFGQGLLC